MAVYKIEAPDGSVFDIEGPDNAAPEDVQAFAASEFTRRQDAIAKQTAADRELYDPTKGMSTGEKLLAGAGKAFSDIGMGVKQIFGQVSQEEVDERAALDKPLMDTGAGLTGNIGGQLAMFALPQTKLIQGTQALVRGGTLAKGTAGLAAAGATGAGVEALGPVETGETRGGEAIEGALWGAGGQAAGNVLGRAIRGLVKTNPRVAGLPNTVRARMTLGQMADPRSLSGRVAASTEEKLRSVPLAGDVISQAREGGRDAWRRSVVNSTAPQGFESTAGSTREAVDEIGGEFQRRYAGALQGLTTGPSPAFENRMLGHITNPQNGLLPNQQDDIFRQVSGYYDNMFGVSPGAPAPTRTPSAEEAKRFEAFLSGLARRYNMVQENPQAPAIARVLSNIEQDWQLAMRGQMPAAQRRALRPLDQRYAPFKTVERAASYVGNDMGDFTPGQLDRAVKARTAAPRYARNNGMLQESANDGRSMFMDRVPNSGTADRALTVGALGGMIAAPYEAAIGLGLGIPAMTTQIGKNTMTGNTRLQRMLQQMRVDRGLTLGGAPAGGAFEEYHDQ